MVKRIAVLGPESTGKSVLSKQLSERFNTVFVKEYSRDYFLNREYSYNIHDLEKIALQQLNNEQNLYTKANNIIICDTEFITLKVWSDVVFGKTPTAITNLITSHMYDLYLLCNLDVEWEPDPLRNNSHNRQEIYNRFVSELEHHNLNYRIVSGTNDDRVKNAVTFVQQTIK